MPSAFTHAFSGAAVSALAPRRFRGARLAFLLAAIAALPDLDVLAFRLGIPYAHPFGHRGFSHSLTCALFVALLLSAWLCRGSSLWSRSGVGLLLVIFAASASHGFLDAFTDAGLGVGFFVPFSSERFFFPWRPVLTSPLSIEEFFSRRGVMILRNELIWIWLPIGALLMLAVLVRVTLGHRSSSTPPPTRST